MITSEQHTTKKGTVHTYLKYNHNKGECHQGLVKESDLIEQLLGTALILILLCVTGCTRNISVSDYCLLYRPVYADYDNDTPETIKQIDSNNIVYDTVCDDK